MKDKKTGDKKRTLADNTPTLASPRINTKDTTRPAQLKRLKRQGQPETRPSSGDPESWLARADSAETLEDALLYLNRALTLNPHHRTAARKMDNALQHILYHNAYLGYVNETETFYRVETGASLVLNIPKERATPEPYPPKKTSPVQPAYRWLAVALLGLPLAGLGTFIGLPLALMYAARAYRQSLSPADQVRANVVVMMAVILGAAAFTLLLLFVLHI